MEGKEQNGVWLLASSWHECIAAAILLEYSTVFISSSLSIFPIQLAYPPIQDFLWDKYFTVRSIL